MALGRLKCISTSLSVAVIGRIIKYGGDLSTRPNRIPPTGGGQLIESLKRTYTRNGVPALAGRNTGDY